MRPGETRNPRGSSAKARAMAKVRRLSADDLAELTSMLLHSTRTDIKKVLADERASFMQQWTAKLLGESYNKGDVAIYRAILDRVVGRPKETKEVSGPNGGAIEVDTRGETYQELAARAEALRQARLAVDEGKDDA